MSPMRRFVIAFCLAAMFPIWCGPAAAQVLLRDAEIENWIEDMSHPLYEAAGLQPETVNIYLIGDPTPNAAAGGLNMLIHTGLITLADTPNQVEGVIAHETGHIAGGHSARTADAIARASRPAMLSLVLGAALLAAGAPPAAGFGALGLGQQVAQGNFLAYSRGQESAADQAAVTYLDSVGHSSRGLLEFFDKLSNEQLISGNRPPPYLLTHPLALQRSNALRQRAEKSPFWEDPETDDEIYKLRMVQAKIHGFMNDPRVTHRQYPLTNQSDPARYARAVAYYRASDLEAASREIDRLIAKHPDNPYFHELKGQMLFEHGFVAEAVPPHRTSIKLAPQHALLKVNLARALLATEDTSGVDEAAVLLGQALRMEPGNSFAWTELARAYSFQGHNALAALSQAEAYFYGGNALNAHRFATRARNDLQAGTPEYQQALDIIVATEEDARKALRNGRR
ncbi:MAG: M48 family metalloprotease [Pseudomonadota bacterium]